MKELVAVVQNGRSICRSFEVAVKLGLGWRPVRDSNRFRLTKSFIMYEKQNSYDESGSLIKIHYDSSEFEEKIVELFRKKVTIHFEKESGRNRYQVVKNSK